MDLQARQDLYLNQEPAHSLLVVDDEEGIRELCRRALSRFRVHLAANGREALEILKKGSIDLVLTDVMMPEMSGLELLEEVRQKDREIPFIIMTGFGDKDVILRALKAGADDFIHKPVNLLQLKTAIDKVLERQQLNRELRQLQRVDRLKSEFLGLISHKLKTPVTSISLIMQNLAGELKGAPLEIQEALRLAIQESQKLAELIQGLLSYSDIILGNNGTELLATNWRDLVHNSLAVLDKQLSDRNMKIGLGLEDELPPLVCDPRRMLFALRALIDNACKFSPPGTMVTIDGKSTDRETVVIIRDQGSGIPSNERAKVLEKFYQIDPDNTGQVPGFGLGLYYAHQFIQELGGDLTLQANPGGGTQARLSFPLPSSS